MLLFMPIFDASLHHSKQFLFLFEPIALFFYTSSF